MRISARSDYAVRAVVELASAGAGAAAPVRASVLSEAQRIPHTFLENILADLRRSGIVYSQRGVEGGYRLARPAGQISLADVIRAVDGPMASVRGERPQDLEYAGSAEALQDVWIAVRASLRSVLERVTVADVVAGELPEVVRGFAADPDAWKNH